MFQGLTARLHGLLAMGLILGLASLCSPAAAQPNTLKDYNLHCGFTPKLDTIQDLEDNAKEYNEEASLETRYAQDNLLLVLHFESGSARIPSECIPRLEQLAMATKQGQHAQLVLRSSTQTGSSSELDLALANQRLNAVFAKLRQQRLARRAMLVELHAQPINPLLDDGLATPGLIEIYSKSTN